MSLTVSITDKATPHITRVEADLSSPAVKHSAGSSVMFLILMHLLDLDSARPNALGGRRTHFYSNAAKSTNYKINDEGATVSISSVGIAQRLFGGDIKPVNSKYLAIPARAEAHGRRAREFNNLELLFGRNGPYALAERQNTELRWRSKTFKIKGHEDEGEIKEKYKYTAAGADRGSGIFYWLVKSVHQDPDPTVLPETSVILETARNAVNDYIRSKVLTK